ncbi:MAG: hypothetical protein ACLQFR_23160 [Streptosporangiaceae bacterium]
MAEAGRAAAGEGIQAAVDVELAMFWRTLFQAGLERESEGGGGLVTLAGRRAAPYLMRRQEWGLASTLLEQVLQRDESPATVGAVLPMLGRIAEATKGTDRELVDAGVLARAFLAAGRRDEAEARMREGLARAAECGNHRLASGMAGDLISLLRDTGRVKEALGLVETKKVATRQAGLGLWTQLFDEVRRLQLLADLGRYDEVLAEVEALRPRMDALPLTSTQDEAVLPWSVREALLDIGGAAAMQLKRWEQVLSLNAEVAASQKGRGASALEVARTRFNDYKPLIGLCRYGEAHALLMECREVFEAEGDLRGLGLVFSALADLEDRLGHRDPAIRHEQTALRYSYAVGEPDGCAIGHFNLANYLMGRGGPPTESLAHRLASMVIWYQTASGHFSTYFQALSLYLASFAPGAPPLPADFAALCATVDQVEGVDLAALFHRLPKTRAATGDDALRQVLDLARQQPPPKPSPV